MKEQLMSDKDYRLVVLIVIAVGLAALVYAILTHHI
jgi:hypothetical protein